MADDGGMEGLSGAGGSGGGSSGGSVFGNIGDAVDDAYHDVVDTVQDVAEDSGVGDTAAGAYSKVEGGAASLGHDIEEEVAEEYRDASTYEDWGQPVGYPEHQGGLLFDPTGTLATPFEAADRAYDAVEDDIAGAFHDSGLQDVEDGAGDVIGDAEPFLRHGVRDLTEPIADPLEGALDPDPVEDALDPLNLPDPYATESSPSRDPAPPEPGTGGGLVSGNGGAGKGASDGTPRLEAGRGLVSVPPEAGFDPTLPGGIVGPLEPPEPVDPPLPDPPLPGMAATPMAEEHHGEPPIDELGFVGSRTASYGATVFAERGGVAAAADARGEAHVDGPLGVHVGAGGQVEGSAAIDIGRAGVGVDASAGADVLGVDAEATGSAHVGMSGAGAAGVVGVDLGDSNVSAGSSMGADGAVEVGGGDVSVHADTRGESHLDVFGAHGEAGVHTTIDANVGVDERGVDAGVSGGVDAFGVDVGAGVGVHAGTDGLGADISAHEEAGVGPVSGGVSTTHDSGVEWGGGEVSAHDSSDTEASADVFGANVEVGLESTVAGRVGIEEQGIGGTYTVETDQLGIEERTTTEGYVGLDGASLSETGEMRVGDSNLNVTVDGTGEGHVDISSGLDAGATGDVAVGADIRGFDLGVDSGFGTQASIGGDGVSVGLDTGIGVEVGGTRVDASAEMGAAVGLDGASADANIGVSGVAGVGGGVDVGRGGAEVSGSVDLGGMHASGEYGTDDMKSGWESGSDAAGDAWESASDAAGDAWESASNAAGDATDDAEEEGEDVVDDVGEATGLW